MARVVKIYLRPSSRTPVRSVNAVTAIAGSGLEGDHAGGGNRQVTLIEAEAWKAACGELGRDLDAGARRANIVVEGLRLGETIGRRIQLGDCLVRVVGETRPCKLMDDAAPGLQKVLSPDRRGGVHGRVISGGAIKVGDEVKVLPVESRAEA